MFYLNYVGCKVVCELIIIIICSCFTLTMWDVKEARILKTEKDVEFYLNYVGCKGEDKRGISKWLICFTLTMWDVKYKTRDKVGMRLDAFYLNYVGCKVILHNLVF